MATNTQVEGDGMETMIFDIHSSEDECGDVITDQPNKLESNDNTQCVMIKCVRRATTKCGKCDSKICDIHIGSFFKQYAVLCKSCNDQRLSLQYDQDNKCINKSQRIICNKCSLIIIALLICLVLIIVLMKNE